jgi:integrase
MPNSTDKPNKPRGDFPLYAHASGQWAKRIRGRVHYFGKWADPQAARERFAREKDDLYAGRTPSNGDGLTVRELVNHFLTREKRKIASGEITERTFEDYKDNCERVLKVLGRTTLVDSLRPTDFARLRANFAKTHGATTLWGDVSRTRVLFNYAAKNFDKRVSYGDSFKKPSRSVLRRARQQRAPRLFSASECRKLIAAAGQPLQAMIYLGLNCGFGNNDCAMLPLSALDLKNKWINFPRPKTGIGRRCPLWPETVKAINAAMAKRPLPIESLDDKVFITKYGNTWEPKTVRDNPVGKEFTKLLKSDDLKLHRKGVGFYALRHVFQTIGEKSRDKDAVRAIMGHAEDANDMSAVYSEDEIEDDRLLAVVAFIRTWLRKTQ